MDEQSVCFDDKIVIKVSFQFHDSMCTDVMDNYTLCMSEEEINLL